MKEQKEHYVDKEYFKVELLRYHNELKEDPEAVPSDALGVILMDIVNNYASKPCWSTYTYLDDMKGDAQLRMVLYLPKLDPLGNPFSYCTSICFSSFMARITKNKRYERMKRGLAQKHLSDIENNGELDREKQKQILDDIGEALD